MVRQLQAPSRDGRRKNERLFNSNGKKFWKRAKRRATTPAWTRHDFEERPYYNIVVFTQVAHDMNRSRQKRELERHEIDQEWTHLIQKIYPADDPKSYELLAQIECPLYDGYWEKRADAKAFFERERQNELYGFNKSSQKPTHAQRVKWPGSILILDHELRGILIPRVLLLALQQLNYLEFVKSVLHANPLRKISKFTMEELWVAVVTKIYHFEDTLDKELKIGETKECSPAVYHALAEDYRSAYEAATERVWAKWYLQVGNKRERVDTASQEENSDAHDVVETEQEEIYGQDERAGKRQKTQEFEGYVQVRETHEETEAPRLGVEQEEVGALHFDEAAWTDFGGEQGPSANFQFADTGIPFRFKG